MGGINSKVQNTKTDLSLQIAEEAIQHAMRENHTAVCVCVEGRVLASLFAGLSGEHS